MKNLRCLEHLPLHTCHVSKFACRKLCWGQLYLLSTLLPHRLEAASQNLPVPYCVAQVFPDVPASTCVVLNQFLCRGDIVGELCLLQPVAEIPERFSHLTCVGRKLFNGLQKHTKMYSNDWGFLNLSDSLCCSFLQKTAGNIVTPRKTMKTSVRLNGWDAL